MKSFKENEKKRKIFFAHIPVYLLRDTIMKEDWTEKLGGKLDADAA